MWACLWAEWGAPLPLLTWSVNLSFTYCYIVHPTIQPVFPESPHGTYRNEEHRLISHAVTNLWISTTQALLGQCSKHGGMGRLCQWKRVHNLDLGIRRRFQEVLAHTLTYEGQYKYLSKRTLKWKQNISVLDRWSYMGKSLCWERETGLKRREISSLNCSL